MMFSANARSALRKAVTSHPDWKPIQKGENINISVVGINELLTIAERLYIDIQAVREQADRADNEAHSAPAWKQAKAQSEFNSPVPEIEPGIEPEEPVQGHNYTPEQENEVPVEDKSLIKADGDNLATTLLPWSEKDQNRFDQILSLVDPAASFSNVYKTAQTAIIVASEYRKAFLELRDKPVEAAPPARIDQVTKSVSFVPPSWSRHFEDLVLIGATIAIVGPSGNGKTTSARKLLEGMSYTVYELDCTDATLPQDIIGRTALESENGTTVTNWTAGPLAMAFGDPQGALLLNEYDALDPRSALALQSALEAGNTRRATAPDTGEQLTSQGPCPIILTMNTIGHGASVQYQGRNALDGANRDRVEIIITTYENEEAILIAHGAEKVTANRLAAWANRARAKLATINSMEILSNRRLLTAAKLVDQRQMPIDAAIDMAFTCRLNEHEKGQFANAA